MLPRQRCVETEREGYRDKESMDICKSERGLSVGNHRTGDGIIWLE
jgi:hypothetical protein